MSTWTYMNIKGQGHSFTLVQGHSDTICSDFFSLETARPIEAKFYEEPPWDWGTNVYTNGPGHMTSMVKTLKKSFSLETKSGWPWKLVCSIGFSSTTKFIQMMTLGYAFVWEKGKMDFSKTIVGYNVKVGRCSQLHEYMKLYENQRSRSFIDFGPNHSDSIFLNFFSSITADYNISSALRWAIQDQWSSGLSYN